MSGRLFIVSVFTLIILTNNAFPSVSAESPKKEEESKAEQIKGKIVITASTLSADNKSNTALFEGSVIAKNEDMTLYSDSMRVYYIGQTGNVTKIEAHGRVRLIKKDLVVTSKAATYFADEEKIIFTGEPKAVERGNIVTGTKMIHYMKENRSVVENSRALLENKKNK